MINFDVDEKRTEYFCPECHTSVWGPAWSIIKKKIICTNSKCKKVFHNHFDNQFDWSLDWEEQARKELVEGTPPYE